MLRGFENMYIFIYVKGKKYKNPPGIISKTDTTKFFYLKFFHGRDCEEKKVVCNAKEPHK